MHSAIASEPQSTPYSDAAEVKPPDVELLTSQEQLYALKDEWNSLLEQSANPNVFLTWEWAWTWWEAFGADFRPWILTARETSGKRLVGLAPFVLGRAPFRGGPYRELAPMGAATMAGDHLDIIARTGWEAICARRIAEFLQAHRRQWDVLSLDWIADDSLLAALLQQQNRRPAMVWASICPYLRLPDCWDKLLSQIDKDLRRKIKSSANRLIQDASGQVEYQKICSPEELAAAMEELSRMHQAIRESRGDRGSFHSSAAGDFHLRAAQRFLEKGWLRLYTLKAGGRIIAANYCIHHHSRVSFYLTGYDRAWSQCRPGLLIMAHAIRTAIEEGAREFDFLRGLEPYKRDWTRTARRDLRLRLSANAAASVLVRAYRTGYAARLKYRQWRGQLNNENAFTIDHLRHTAVSGQE